MKYDLIIPTILRDLYKVLNNYELFERYIPFKSMVLIGDEEVEKVVRSYNSSKANSKIIYLNEKVLGEYNVVKNILGKLSDNDDTTIKRTGWYYQQFLKMYYAYVCDDEYYMFWDSDTLPIKKIDMFNDEGIPYFDITNEYHEPYFKTIENIFGIKKMISESFLAEHMIVKTEYMKEMLEEIKNMADMEKSSVCEFILKNVPLEALYRSGFSEQETFGTWCMNRHPGQYELRTWKKIRSLNRYFEPNNFDDATKEWIGKNYDTVAFEKQTDITPIRRFLFQTTWFRKIISFEQMIKINDMRELICRIIGKRINKLKVLEDK